MRNQLGSLRCVLLFLAAAATARDGTPQGGWTQQIPMTSPAARAEHAMALDTVRRRVVLFGGRTAGGQVLGDTWVWDSTDWIQMTPATSPPARSQHGMAPAGANGVLLFGGVDMSGAYLSDTWLWNGVTWSQLSPAMAPSSRGFPALARDSGRGRIVLFGGRNASGYLGDTWEWDGSTWAPTAPAASPSSRVVRSLAYNPSRSRTMLFGGGDASTAFGDTWEWDGANWNHLMPTSSPAPRRCSGLMYSPERARNVLFGGTNGATALSDTWEWAAGTWVQTASTPAIARFDFSVAYDPLSSSILLFGGRDGVQHFADSWTYSSVVPLALASFVSPVGDLDPVSVGSQILGGVNPFPGNLRNDDLFGRDPSATGPRATGEYRLQQIDGELQPAPGKVINNASFRRDNLLIGYDPFEATPRVINVAMSLGIGRYDTFATNFDNNFFLPPPVGSTRAYTIGSPIPGARPVTVSFALPSLQQLLPPVGNGAQRFLPDLKLPFDSPYVIPASSGGGGGLNSVVWDLQVCIIHPRFGRYPLDANQTLDQSSSYTLSGTGCTVPGRSVQMTHKIFGTHQVSANLFRLGLTIESGPSGGSCVALLGQAAVPPVMVTGLCTSLYIDPSTPTLVVPLTSPDPSGLSVTLFSIPWFDSLDGATFSSQALCASGPLPTNMVFASNRASHAITAASPKVKSIFAYLCTDATAFRPVQYGFGVVVGFNQ